MAYRRYLRGMGDYDANFGLDPSLIDFSPPPVVNYPAAPGSGVVYAPADPNCTSGMPYDINGNLCPGATPMVPKTVPSAGSIFDTASSNPIPKSNPIYNTLPPGPAPRVNVPLTASSVPMYLTNSTLIAGLPNWAVFAGLFLGVTMLPSLLSGGKRRR